MTHASTALLAVMNVEIDSYTQPNGGGTLVVAYNGTLTNFEAPPADPCRAGCALVTPTRSRSTFYAGTNGPNSDNAGPWHKGVGIPNR